MRIFKDWNIKQLENLINSLHESNNYKHTDANDIVIDLAETEIVRQELNSDKHYQGFVFNF